MAILCCVPTRGRYDVLIHCLQGISTQTLAPTKLNIYDDTPEAERIDLRDHPIAKHILRAISLNGTEWQVLFTPGFGQHVAHQMANTSEFEFVWRLDDDCVPRPDVLEKLSIHMAPDVGGVAGAVYEPDRLVPGGSGRITDLFHCANLQWSPNQGTHEVDHLYGSFLYRAGIVHYKHVMSTVAFREETIFSHRLKRAGYRLIVDTSIHTLHCKSPSGGTRTTNQAVSYLWDHDEFMRLMEKEWGIKLIHLGVGLGDCIAFRNILPELQQKWPTLLIGSCHPYVFDKIPGVEIIPYPEAKKQSEDNIYNWMSEHRWTGHIIDAYREMYR